MAAGTSRNGHDVIGVTRITTTKAWTGFTLGKLHHTNDQTIQTLVQQSPISSVNETRSPIHIPKQTKQTVTMRISRTPTIRNALRPAFQQATRLQPGCTRLASTSPGAGPEGEVGDKGTAKVYNKDGTNPNKNLMYVTFTRDSGSQMTVVGVQLLT
jgi:hypothetical protein